MITPTEALHTVLVLAQAQAAGLCCKARREADEAVREVQKWLAERKP